MKELLKDQKMKETEIINAVFWAQYKSSQIVYSKSLPSEGFLHVEIWSFILFAYKTKLH